MISTSLRRYNAAGLAGRSAVTSRSHLSVSFSCYGGRVFGARYGDELAVYHLTEKGNKPVGVGVEHEVMALAPDALT